MKKTEIAPGEYPGRFVRRRPITKLECELISVAAEQKSVDGRLQAACPVLFAGTLERRKPIDASICGGDITIEAGGDVVNDLGHNRVRRLTAYASATWPAREIVAPTLKGQRATSAASESWAAFHESR